MRVFAMRKFAGRGAFTVFSLCLGMLAQAQSFQPARLGDAAQHLEQTVTRPNLTKAMPVASVYCQADVSAEGLTSNVICYEKEGFDQLREQTAAAMTGRNLQAASVDGAKVPVRMYFRAVYSDLEGQPSVLVLPNLGNMQSQYGLDYSAPQERLDQPQWYESYSSNDWSEGKLFFSERGPLTRLVAVVNKDGEAITVRRIEAHGRHKRDAVEVEKALKKAQFIPGFAEGRPERMQYVAVLHHPR